MKLKLEKTSFIHIMVIYTMYNPTLATARFESVTNNKACKLNNNNVEVSVQQGDVELK